jgi:hypothetical protein
VRSIPDQELKATSLPRLDTLAQNPLLKNIPIQYTKYTEIFKERPQEDTLLKYQLWDHEIKLEEGKELLFLLIILLSEEKLKLFRKYLDENLAKGFIRESASPIKAPIFFIPKKGDKKGRPVINYCKLNTITIKDRYLLLLASEL